MDNLVSEAMKSDAPPPPPPTVKAMPDSYQMAAPLSEGELTNLLMSSPLYQKLEAIKSLLRDGAGKGVGSSNTAGKTCTILREGNSFVLTHRLRISVRTVYLRTHYLTGRGFLPCVVLRPDRCAFAVFWESILRGKLAS